MSKKQIPNITNLHAEKGMKTQAKNEIFTIVLNKCIDKIIETNHSTDQTFIYFEVPNLIIGFHSYDRIECIRYLINELSREKYKVEFVDPYYVYIDWSTNVQKSKKIDSYMLQNVIPTSNPIQLQQQTKELLKKYPNTSKIVFEYEDLDKKKDAALKKKNNKK